MRYNINMDIFTPSKHKAIVNYNNGDKIKLPSQKYPLNGLITVFAYQNTLPVNDKEIERIFDEIKPVVGMCYSNSYTLAHRLIECGVDNKRVKTYVGWLFLGEAKPVHHCMVVLDDKHILDYSVFKIMGDYRRYPDVFGMETIRHRLSEDMIQELKKPNAEYATFGQAMEFAIYVVSECAPMEGIKIRDRVQKAFPKHPGFNKVDESGLTEAQRVYYKKKKALTQ